MQHKQVGIATVVDAHPRFWCELVLWVLCTNRHLTNPKRVYFVGEVPAKLEAFVRDAGIEVRHVKTLMAHSPHCNKLIPFLDPDGFENQIVTDCDVFATDDFSSFFRYNQIRLPPNNHAVPPLSLFEDVFAKAGLETVPEPGLSIFPGGGNNMETFSGNVSAGIICIPKPLRGFAERWRAQAQWFSENLELLGRFSGPVDQISIAVAAARDEIPFSHFPAQGNAILQLLPVIRNLYALHLTSGHIPKYPEAFDDMGHLRTDLLPRELHNKITEFNRQVDLAFDVLSGIPETAACRSILLNPKYQR
jgi:hypothetical protein